MESGFSGNLLRAVKAANIQRKMNHNNSQIIHTPQTTRRGCWSNWRKRIMSAVTRLSSSASMLRLLVPPSNICSIAKKFHVNCFPPIETLTDARFSFFCCATRNVSFERNKNAHRTWRWLPLAESCTYVDLSDRSGKKKEWQIIRRVGARPLLHFKRCQQIIIIIVWCLISLVPPPPFHPATPE